MAPETLAGGPSPSAQATKNRSTTLEAPGKQHRPSPEVRSACRPGGKTAQQEAQQLAKGDVCHACSDRREDALIRIVDRSGSGNPLTNATETFALHSEV